MARNYEKVLKKFEEEDRKREQEEERAREEEIKALRAKISEFKIEQETSIELEVSFKINGKKIKLILVSKPVNGIGGYYAFCSYRAGQIEEVVLTDELLKKFLKKYRAAIDEEVKKHLEIEDKRKNEEYRKEYEELEEKAEALLEGIL